MKAQNNFALKESYTQNREKLKPPQTWNNSEQHFSAALNHPWYKIITQLNGLITYSTNDYFRKKNYLPALMPITSEAVTSPMGLGSDSLPVSINLFDKTTYLADSMQFHLEYMLRQHPQGVFYIMPTFRGEDSDERHLNQFFHIEAEFCGKLDDLISTIEGLIISYTESIIDNMQQEFQNYGLTMDHMHRLVNQYKNGFPRITFREACRILGTNAKWYNMLDGNPISLTGAAEKEILKKFGEAVWLTHLPKLGVPFYQADAEDGQSALCADLLLGIGETAGCGQRHYSYESTLNAIKERGVDPSAYDWYLRMKKEYPLQTCGFGIGLERYLLWVLQHDDIRDTHMMVRLKGQKCIP